MLDETVINDEIDRSKFDDTKDTTTSINSQIFDLSINNDKNEENDINQIDDGKYGDFIATKNFENIESFDLPFNDDDSNLDFHCDRDCISLIKERSSLNSDSSSRLESVCTECKFFNEMKVFIDSANNTQSNQMEMDDFSIATNRIFHDYNDVNNYENIRKSLLKRSFSNDTRSKIQIKPFIRSNNRLKKFKSEENIRGIIKRSKYFEFINRYDIGNNWNIDEKFAKLYEDEDKNRISHFEKFLDTKIVGNVLNETNSNVLNTIIESEKDEILAKNDSNCNHSMISRNTVEEIHRIDYTNDVRRSKNEGITSKVETYDPKSDDSSLSDVGIEASPHIERLNDVKMIIGIPRREKDRGDMSKSIIHDRIIEVEENLDTTTTEFGLQKSDEKRRELNPTVLSVSKSSENNVTLVDERNDDKEVRNVLGDVELQHLTEIELKKTETIDKPMNSVDQIDDSATDVGSTIKTGKSGKTAVSKLSNDSLLEISVEAEMEEIVKQVGKISSARVVQNLKTDSISQINANADNEKKKQKESVDLTTFIANAKVNSVQNVEEKEKKIQSLKDDLGLDSLSESQLQIIEREAYAKAKERNDLKLQNVKLQSVYHDQNVFYKPERSNVMEEKKRDDYLVLPDWVTKPAPEPDYDKIRRANEMRRRYIKKMLQEILRLSDIVSKLWSSVVNTKDLEDDWKRPAESSSQIQHLRSIKKVENKPENPSSAVSATEFKDSSIFYVPQSSKFNYNLRTNMSNHVNDGSEKFETFAHTLTIKTNPSDRKEDGKFYVPQSSLSKDIPPILNRIIDTNINSGRIFGNRSEDTSRSYDASSIFSSLKDNFDPKRIREPDISDVRCRAREAGIDTENRKLETNTDYLKLPKTGFNARDEKTLNSGNMKGSSRDIENVRSLDNDTIFYSSVKLSSTSNNYKRLNGARSSEINSSQNYAKRFRWNQIKPNEQKSTNFGKNSTAGTNNCNNSIFYNGSKKVGNGF